jgi:gliding motility-associated-like protein
MRKSALYFVALLLVIIPFFASAQTNISGVINVYTPVTGFTGCNSVTVQSSAGFTVGTKALIIQMKGADIDQSNTAAFGTITDYHNAGNYEIIHITGITGNTIDYEFQLLNQYDLTGKVQLITIPEYTNATVTGTLTGAPWDGTVGGVLIFIASGNVTMNGDIDNSGKGFRGGNYSLPFSQCHYTDYYYPIGNGAGAEKGEGISNIIVGKESGRGPLANGGGGGNAHNGGGGGGGNAATGGLGGHEYDGSFCSGSMNTNTRGIGGNSLNYSNALEKIYLGGGGGGGQQNNNEGMLGTDGGGIIIIKANSIINNGFEIFSNGIDAPLSGLDAAGGGGAGGTILLDVQNFTNVLTVTAGGGKGGDIDHSNPNCWGPGGGGAGGVTWFSNPPPGNVTSILSGGLAGLRITPSSSCYNTSHGGTDGNIGLSLNGLNIPESSIPISTILTHAGNDTSICTTTTFALGNTPIATGGTTPYTYAWLPATGLNNPALANPQATPVSTTTYTLTVTDNNGCIGRDTIIVSVGIININITAPEDSICPGDALALTVSGSTSNLLWSTGATTTSVTVNNPGNYWVSSQSGGCTASDTILIAQNNPPLVALGNDIINCTPTDVQLSAPVLSNTTYLWSTGATTNSVTVNADGTYWLEITDGCGTSSDTVEITTTTIAVNAGNDTTLCNSSSIILGATPVATGGTAPYTYAWLPSADLDNATLANPTATPTATTTYTLTVTDDNGCLGHDTILLTIGEGSVAITAPENTICPGDALTLTATANADSYLWSTGESTAAIDINTPGDYWVQSTTGDCDANDTITIAAGEAPVFSLGNDTVVCSDISHNLKIPNVFNGDYLWSNGETTQSINVEGSGTYWLQVENGCGTGIDSIVVTFQSDSSKHVFFPNCFTPNSDKTNETFVLLNAPANEYDFTVYNRWGNIIFQSFEPTNNWDGTYKGRDVEEGVYYFVATFKDCKGERLRKAGHITVLR